VDETVDQVKEPRSAWTYNPGQRRVRLAPQVAYDNPGTASDGLRTSDDFQMYNGATDRYNWKLVGKQEMYIPYNSTKLSGNEIKVADLFAARPHQPRPRALRIASRLVVEATLKEGTNHIYKKRVFYLDEDSWSIAVTDKYDARMELWRVAEQHSINFYDIPMLYGTIEVHYDLQSARYLAMGIRTTSQGLREDQARQGGLHARRPARNRHPLRRTPPRAARGPAAGAPVPERVPRDRPMMMNRHVEHRR